MSDESDIYKALLSHLESFDFDSFDLSSDDVAWPNMLFTPQVERAWFRPTLLPADTVQASLGPKGANFHTGLLQVDLFWPKGRGLGAPDDVAGALVAHFAMGSTVSFNGQNVHVGRPPTRRPSPDDDWYLTVIRIPFYAYTENPL